MSANEKTSSQSGKPTPAPNIQGEGDYESTRKFREDTEQFLKGADVRELARQAAPKSKEEAAELKKAEELGRSRSHSTDISQPAAKPAPQGNTGAAKP